MSFFYKKNKYILWFIISIIISTMLTSCDFDFLYTKKETEAETIETTIIDEKEKVEEYNPDPIITEKIYVDFSAPYATYSIINDGYATLYTHNPIYHQGTYSNLKRKTIAVNAGHGTKKGSKIKTFSHPDFTPKVAGGTTKEGSILSPAISDGMVFHNGMLEADANLLIALLLKQKLFDDGYEVLMIREDDDCRLDNIARTVIANENADIHIAIHFDSTDYDKGIFYVTPYNDESYLNMEPLKHTRASIKKLGKAIIKSYREMGEKVWKESGSLQGDLTQLSYSTIANVDIELGDAATVLDEVKIKNLVDGLKKGIDYYFEEG